MKKYALALLLGAGLVANTALAEGIKVGVIDVQAVLQKSPHVAEVSKQLEGEFKPRADKIKDADKRLQEEADKLNKDGSVMSNKERQALQDKVFLDKRELQRMQQDFQDDFNLAQNKALQQLVSKISAVVQDIAKKGNYDMILDSRAVPYASPSVDITAEVVKQVSK